MLCWEMSGSQCPDINTISENSTTSVICDMQMNAEWTFHVEKIIEISRKFLIIKGSLFDLGYHFSYDPFTNRYSIMPIVWFACFFIVSGINVGPDNNSLKFSFRVMCKKEGSRGKNISRFTPVFNLLWKNHGTLEKKQTYGTMEKN